ncbi:MAG: sugar phosphate isomerase/epimerase [Clostridia bacterium]|nr:sugar phosphate isomerase/epimerase [Clostridia bacterium]
MFEIGLSTCSKIIDENLFLQYREAGISAMEIAQPYDEIDLINYNEISSLSKEYGIRLNSFHLPFAPFNTVDISNPSAQAGTIEYHTQLIKKAAAIGIEKFILHPSAEPIKADRRKERMNCAKDSLSRLAEIAHREGAVLCVEDLPRTCLGRNSEEIAELVSVDERLRLCLDTNHLFTEALPDYIRKFGKRIVTIHVSDYDFLNERHWLPGEGDIDWQSVASALKEVGYEGPWLYEVGFERPDSLLEGRPLTCEDIVRNAKQIFAGEKPAAIAERKRGLEKWVEQL